MCLLSTGDSNGAATFNNTVPKPVSCWTCYNEQKILSFLRSLLIIDGAAEMVLKVLKNSCT